VTATISPDQFLDPIWRLHNLYFIIDEKSKRVQFTPNAAQLDFIQNMHTRNVILKARRLGFTTVCCLAYLDDCLFHPNVTAALIAHKLPDAQKIFASKVKYPYDNLADQLRERLPLKKDSADSLGFANNSEISVTTSARSGTLNWLHVSEYGKICAMSPERAREIRTGSFPAAEHGIITIESTAEGEGGDFYDKTIDAQKLVSLNADLTRKDFKFFFYPWWSDPKSVLERTNVPVSEDDALYFERISNEIKADPVLAPTFNGFSEAQKNWWVTAEGEYGGDMKREYPATPKEAFEQAIEGAIFADDLAIAYKQHRIGPFPIDTSRPVHTFWDLGRADETAIWFAQDFGSQTRFVGYYENSGEFIDFYLRYLARWADEHHIVYGKHYVPHDGDRDSLWLKEGTMAVMSRLGFKPRVVDRIADKWTAITMGRRKFGQVAFDEAGCKEGLARLKKYRKEWDERRGVWREHPYHGPESNGADAYLTFAQSGHTPNNGPIKVRDKYRQHRDSDTSEASQWAA